MPIDLKIELETMRNNFIFDHGHALNLPKPRRIADDIWRKNYDELQRLKEIGGIHYASYVQANEYLYKYSIFSMKYVGNAPAIIVFSTDRYYDEKPFELQTIARFLFKYKGTNTAPENLKIITDAITDEYQLLHNIKLPDDVSNGVPVFYTTIMVYRQHILDKKVSCPIIPVVTEPNNLQSTMILPKQYWTNNFVSFYKNMAKTA